MAQLIDANTTKTYEVCPFPSSIHPYLSTPHEHYSLIISQGGIVTFGKLRELNVRDNKDLMEIPHDLVALMRPPLLLHTSIPAGLSNIYFIYLIVILYFLTGGCNCMVANDCYRGRSESIFRRIGQCNKYGSFTTFTYYTYYFGYWINATTFP